jgi:hypothetical protein
MNDRLSRAAAALLTVALALLPVTAGAYDFIISSDGGIAPKTVVVHTSSVFCFNRTPVANGVPNLNLGVNAYGTTALGCLIYKVEFFMPDGSVVTWNPFGVGVGSSVFTLSENDDGRPVVNCMTIGTNQDC